MVLSGPTIAGEVAQGIPTTAVAACKDQKLALIVQEIFNSESFRIYTNTDVIGVEFGGSVKNVIALACLYIFSLPFCRETFLFFYLGHFRLSFNVFLSFTYPRHLVWW